MQQYFLKHTKALIAVCACSALVVSCSKNPPIIDAVYPAQTVYLNEAAITTVPSGTGIYPIAAAVEGLVKTYTIDTAKSRFNIPLGVTKSGISLAGSVDVSITPNTDTVAKMLANGKLSSTTVLLPSSAYTIPTLITVPDGGSSASFTLSVDLNQLSKNLNTKYAIGVTISAPSGKGVTSSLSTVVVFIDPSNVLLPGSNFSTYIYPVTKTANFVNLSANAGQYSWNFGDGSPISTATSPSHVYASGTYTVTLTSNGILGSASASVKTTSITIL